MSRSYKKSPFIANTTASSDKECKSKANRKYRRVNKNIIHNFKKDNKEYPNCVLLREVSNIWNMNKDGKSIFWIKDNPKLLRK